MSGTWQEAAERLRQQISTRPPIEPRRRGFVLVSGKSRVEVSSAPRFVVGQLVTFHEGRTRLARRGYVETVYPIDGWPPEYDVQLLRRDGTTGRVSRKFQSELEAEDA